MLELKNISYSYKDNKVFEQFNAEFINGQMYAIVGKSGSGKTTLLSIISGLDSHYQGEVHYRGERVNKKECLKFNRKNVSYIFQELNLIPYLTVYENIRLSQRIKKQKLSTDEQIKEKLKEFDLEQITKKTYPRSLSGGQQQRVAILRTLMTQSDIVIADEPTASLDQENANLVQKQLAKLANEENKIVILVTHDIELANKCDEMIKIG